MEDTEDMEAMVDTRMASVLQGLNQLQLLKLMPMLDICLDMDVIVVSVLQRLDMEETMDVMVVTLVDVVDMGMADMASGAKPMDISLSYLSL